MVREAPEKRYDLLASVVVDGAPLPPTVPNRCVLGGEGGDSGGASGRSDQR